MSSDRKFAVMSYLFRFKLCNLKMKIGKKLYPDGTAFVQDFLQPTFFSGQICDKYDASDDTAPWPDPDQAKTLKAFLSGLESLVDVGDRNLFSNLYKAPDAGADLAAHCIFEFIW